MKFKITADQFKALGPGWDDHYIVQPDGSYRLNVEGAFVDEQDPQSLKNALAEERRQREELGLKVKFFEEQQGQGASEAAEKAAQAKLDAEKLAAEKGNLVEVKTALEQRIADMQAKHEADMKERDDRDAERIRLANETLVQTTAESMANEIFKDFGPTQVANILPRLQVDASNRVVAVDANGNVGDHFTVEDLHREIVDNPINKRMIEASIGSGAGGTQTKPKGSPVDVKGKLWKDVPSEVRVDLARNDPDGYAKLRESRTAGPDTDESTVPAF